jgi:ornithine cyclodeaminase/alanine dehydrogenase-like protein (mu-crystallin family)
MMPPLYFLSRTDVEHVLGSISDSAPLLSPGVTLDFAEPQSDYLNVPLGRGRASIGATYRRSPNPSASDDVLGLYWRYQNRANTATKADGLVVVNDPTTGVPVAILNSEPLEAAVMATLTEAFLRACKRDFPRPLVAAFFGLEARAAPLARTIGRLYPGAEIRIGDKDSVMAREIARTVEGTQGLSAVTVRDDAAIKADVVVVFSGAASAPPAEPLQPSAVATGAIIVSFGLPVGLDLSLAGRGVLVVDDPVQYAELGTKGRPVGYREPDLSWRELVEGKPPADAGQVVLIHLRIESLAVAAGRTIATIARRLNIGTRLR